MQWIEKQKKYRILISNLILAEIANFITRKINYKKKEIINTIINNEKIDMYYDEEPISKKAIEIYKKFDPVGYVDATTAILYKLMKCDYLITFDSDFKLIKGITPLDSYPIDFED